VSADEEAVRNANEAFYRAFESLDLQRMEDAWCHEGRVSCVHPGWPLASDWAEVRRSWETIFANTERIRFEIGDARIEVRGELAWVVCVEWLSSQSAAGSARGAVLATNVFRRERGAWRLAHHHASPFVPRTGEESERVPVEPDDEPTRPTGRGKKGVVN
jgi:ketosteroid isomerase-like protein